MSLRTVRVRGCPAALSLSSPIIEPTRPARLSNPRLRAGQWRAAGVSSPGGALVHVVRLYSYLLWTVALTLLIYLPSFGYLRLRYIYAVGTYVKTSLSFGHKDIKTHTNGVQLGASSHWGPYMDFIVFLCFEHIIFALRTKTLMESLHQSSHLDVT